MSSYNNESTPITEIMLNAIKGFAVAVVLAAIMLFGFCAAAYGMDDPDKLTAPLGYLALYLSAAGAGGAASRVSGDMGMPSVLSAAVSGVMLLMLLIIMSFLPAETSGTPLSPFITVLMYAAIPAAASLAGLVFRHKRVRKIKHKRRR